MLLFLLALLLLPAEPSFKAAVIDFVPPRRAVVPATRDLAASILMTNIKALEYQISNLDKDVDVFVSPEYSLTDYPGWTRDDILPYLREHPSNNCNPCADPEGCDIAPSKELSYLSCIAREHNIYLSVTGLNEVEFCDPARDSGCPSDGRRQFNTALFFGRDGRLLAKYHKRNLYSVEVEFLQPGTEYAIVETPDLGRLGLIICYDILFRDPLDYYVAHGVKTILFGTYWVNFGPPNTATSIQQGMSRYHKVNLLASNMGSLACRSSGSGIYSSGHTLASFTNCEDVIFPVLRNKTLTAVVTDEEVDEEAGEAARDAPPTLYSDLKFKIFYPKVGENHVRASTVDKETGFEFFCDVHFTMDKHSGQEQFAVYIGVGSEMIAPRYAWNCGLMSCKRVGPNSDSCDILTNYHSKSLFSDITIESNIPQSLSLYILGSYDSLAIMPESEISNDSGKVFSWKGSQPEPVLHFGLFGFSDRVSGEDDSRGV